MPGTATRTLLLILTSITLVSACSDPTSPPRQPSPTGTPASTGKPGATDSAATPSPTPSPTPPVVASGQPAGDSVRGLVFLRDTAVWRTDSTAQITRLLKPSGEIYAAAVSPTGAVAFAPGAGDQVCIASPSAPDPRCMRPGYFTITPVAWSPDGTQLVMSGAPPATSCGVASVCIAPHRDLLILSVASMTVRPLVKTSDSQYAMGASWSPDGSVIAFAMNDAIWLVNPDGSHQRLLTTSVGGSYGVTAVRWSPDGRKLSVSLEDTFNCPWFCDTAVGIVNADGSGLRVVATATQASGQFVGSWPHGAPIWSPDGSSIAFGQSDCSRGFDPCREDVMVVGATGGPPQPLLQNAVLLAWHRG